MSLDQRLLALSYAAVAPHKGGAGASSARIRVSMYAAAAVLKDMSLADVHVHGLVAAVTGVVSFGDSPSDRSAQAAQLDDLSKIIMDAGGSILSSTDERISSNEKVATFVRGVAKGLVKPGEGCDVVARKFWSTSFFSTTGSTSFNNFFDKGLKYAADYGQTTAANAAAMQKMSSSALKSSMTATFIAGNIPAERVERAQSLARYERSVRRELQRGLVGNSKDITPLHLQQLIEDSESGVFPDAIIEAVEKLGEKIPSLDPLLADLVEECKGIDDKEGLRVRLADHSCVLREIAKLSTSDLATYFANTLGLADNDAKLFATAVFMWSRQYIPNAIVERNRCEKATAAIDAKDLKIDLSSCHLDSVSVEAFTKRIADVNRARDVDLSSNNIHAVGAHLVAKMVETTSTLRHVNLCGNHLQASGIAKVCDAVNKRKEPVHTIDLSVNHAGSAGLRTLSEQVGTMYKLFTVGISGNDAGIDGGAHIAALIRNAPHMKSLSAHSNYLGDEGIAPVCTALKENKTLTQLDVSHNLLTKKGIQSIAQALSGHPVLTCLAMEGNCTMDGLLQVESELVALAKRTPTLEHVVLGAGVALPNLDAALTSNSKALASEALKLSKKSFMLWTTDDSEQWVLLTQRHYALSQQFKASAMDGKKLVWLTKRAMEADYGITDPDHHTWVIDSVGKVLRGDEDAIKVYRPSVEGI